MSIIEQIKAEIERQEKQCPLDTYEGRHKLFILGGLKTFLSTLESEKPINQEGLNEEISKSIENLEGCTTKINDNPEYHLISDEDIRKFARHFAEWGAEHLADARKISSSGLEEAAREYGFEEYRRRCNGGEYGTSEDAFIAGAKWMEEQLKK